MFNKLYDLFAKLRDDDPGRLLVWSSALTLAFFIVWSMWAELDQITRATGQVIASSRNQIIQTADGGVMEELLVKEGASVKRDQLLYRLDKTRAEGAYLETAARAAGLTAAVARLNAEVLGGAPKFPEWLKDYTDIKNNQALLFKRRQEAIRAELASLESSVSLVRQELEMNLPLVKLGDVSRAEILKLQRQVADMEGQIANKRNKYFQDAQAELSKAQEEMEAVNQTLAQRKEALDNTEARAPMDGVVRNVRLTTRGAVARAGEEILQIVPNDDDLVVEAKVRPADIAFVKPGLPATIKLDAYDYTIYGALPGTVTYISADTLNEEAKNNEQPYYRVQVKTTSRTFPGRPDEALDIQPGMTATVEIKTGSQTVLRYLTKPISKTFDESLGER